VCVASALSLSALQRSIEWVASIAKTPQTGMLKDARPLFKKLNIFFERIFAGNKFEITSTEILLMAIVILMICLVIDTSDRSDEKITVSTSTPSKDSKPKAA
jgi:hypothetical protein